VPSEARFAVGSRQGPRSTIWKAWVHGNEAYIATRMFGSDAKVSIHSSGECQWSATSSWIRKKPHIRNSDRHFAKWQFTYPSGHEALLVFKVGIPVSELRSLDPPADAKKVHWVAGAPEGSTIQFTFYITPVATKDPAPPQSDLHRHLFSLKRKDGRWFVALVSVTSLSENDLAVARAHVTQQAQEAGISPQPHYRMCLFTVPSGTSDVRGLLELCLIAA
jgi:hypothetical protein